MASNYKAMPSFEMKASIYIGIYGVSFMKGRFEYEKLIVLGSEVSLSVNVFISGNQIQKYDIQHY